MNTRDLSQNISASLILPQNNWAEYFYVDRFLNRPLLSDVLKEIGPLPEEALFMGQAEDGLPVLLNLHDPSPGPILIVGKSGSGKTDFLRAMAQFVISTYIPSEIQFAVITNRTEEWQERLADASHCIGVFTSRGSDAMRLVHSLAMWVDKNQDKGQSVLLFIDGFGCMLEWDQATLVCLQKTLTTGPKKQVWPIVTLTPNCDPRMHEWISLFRLQIFESDLLSEVANTFGDQSSAKGSLLNRPWFAMKENRQWLRFWIPALGY